MNHSLRHRLVCPSIPMQKAIHPNDLAQTKDGTPALSARLRALIFGLAWLPALASAAFNTCLDQFPKQQAPAIQLPDTRDLCFDSFAILHSAKTKTPVYTVEKLNRKRLEQARRRQRTNRFYEEARLPSRERAQLRDYQGSGFDRGHQAPAGDMPNAKAMAQSFSLANMVPQNRQHNREVWNKIEQDTRKYVLRTEADVFVFTGPYFGQLSTTIGSGVWVPDVVWKLVYNSQTGETWVHWSGNRADQAITPPISYDEFVRRTGLNLLTP
jgi:endonuclease G